jgi:hypothetical protein
MQDELKKRIQLIFAAGILLAGARAAYIFYDRSSAAKQALQQEKERQLRKDTLDRDYYVSLPKLYTYDLPTARRELTKSPVWVRTGYGTAFYPFDTAAKHANFAHQAGLLPPLEKLQITDVIYDHAPSAPGQKQIMAVYANDGKTFAFPIGAEQDGSFTLYANEMLFLADPHELYKHWPPDIWDAIAKHQVHPGMNELQADCAIGIGMLEGSGLNEDRVLHYPNGGSPITITFHNGKAAEIHPGT